MYKLEDTMPGFVCTACEPGFSCSAIAYSVVVTLTLALSVGVEDVSPALQLQYREAATATVDAEVSRVTPRATSRL
jgi:hypothetical protein